MNTDTDTNEGLVFPLELFVFLTLALMALAGLWRIPHKLSLQDNLIVLFISAFLDTIVFTILDRNLRWFLSTDEIEPHIAFIIYRSVVLQIVLLIYANGITHLQGYWRKTGFALLILVIMNGLNMLAVSLRLLTYQVWNAGLFALTFAVYLLVVFLLVHGLTKLRMKGAGGP